MNASGAIKVSGVGVVAHYRRGRDRSSQSLFRQQQSDVRGTLHRWRTGALDRSRREASCREGAAWEKRQGEQGCPSCRAPQRHEHKQG